MAITREQVLAAVERYLPRTANYVRSADFGDRDPLPVFERIQQIVFTTLLVDPDAVYYIVFLASQQLLADVELVVSQLEALQSESQLRGITGEDPVRIEDLSQLTAARTSLVRLSTSVVQEGTFGDTNLADFQADIEGFMSDQVVPNVAGGNKVQISSAIRANMEALKTSWANVLTQRDVVFSLLNKYVEEDLRTRVSVIIISAIQDTLEALETTLPALSTEAQAASAEATLVELAAAEAAITIIGNAPSPVGELVAGPAEDGRTATSYLALEGSGRTQPVLPLLQGDDGRLRLEGPNAGLPFTSLTGTPAAPGPTTDTVVDASVPDFTAEGIEAGQYLTFVDLGTSHEITAVTPTALTISPRTPFSIGLSLRYAITNHAPGRYFESQGTDFWDEFTATAQDTQIPGASGTTGDWERVIKVLGSDGTNIIASGTDGVLRPPKVAGVDGDMIFTSPNFTIATSDPGFISNLVTTSDLLYVDGLNAGGNPYSIAVINGEYDLDITTTFSNTDVNQSWYIEDPLVSPTAFSSVTGTFLTDGITGGDWIVLSGPVSATYTINFAASQTQLDLLSGVLTNTTGVTWELITASEDRLYSDAVDFILEGVIAGDLVDVQGFGTYEIIEVTSRYVRLDATINAGPTPVSGLIFTIYTAPGSNTLVFRHADPVSFTDLDISSTVPVDEYFSGELRTENKAAFLEVDGVSYRIQSTTPVTATIFPLSSGVGKFIIPGQLFRDANATWVTLGVDPAKHEVVCTAGPNVGKTFEILSVNSETELLLTPPGSANAFPDQIEDFYEIRPKVTTSSNLVWEVNTGPTNRQLIGTGFTPDDVGDIFVWKRGTADEQRILVDSYVSATELWLASGIGLASEGPQPAALIRDVKPGMQLFANNRRYTIVDIYDQNTLDIDPKMSNAPGENVEFIIMTSGTNLYSTRILDVEGATAWDDSQGSPGLGFTSDLSGATVNLMVDAPVVARFLQPYDPGGDGFAEAFQVNTNMRLGRRNITYQILLDFDNRSNRFLAAETAPLPLEGDYLTVWDLQPIFTVTDAVSATPDMELTISPAAPAGLLDQNYVVHRGGSQYYGLWVLYEDRNNALTFDPDTDDLRLRVAEVLIEFGELNIISVDSGSAGVVVDDGDQDGLAFGLEDAGADFSGARFGDRLKVTYPDTTVDTTFVTSVPSDTTLRFSPAIREGTALSWVLERNSVSSALEEANRLQQQMEALRTLIQSYIVERNTTVDGIIDLLEDQRLDRAVDLLLSGKVDDFINLTSQTSSFSTRARTAVQSTVSRTVPSVATEGNIAGQNPEAGTGANQSGVTAGAISSTTALSPSSDDPLSEDVDVRVSLAKALAEISSDEVLRGLVFTTFEEQRNRAIFELSGEVESGFVSDEDPTLPWIAKTGSIRARINARYQKARDAVQYMIDHPDEFEDI